VKWIETRTEDGATVAGAIQLQTATLAADRDGRMLALLAQGRRGRAARGCSRRASRT
jgi:hypothetical protein